MLLFPKAKENILTCPGKTKEICSRLLFLDCPELWGKWAEKQCAFFIGFTEIYALE